MVSVAGTMAMLASLCIVFWGFPRQIWLHWKRKSCEGLDSGLVWSAFVSYTLWSGYAIMKPDWFLIIAEVPGFVLTILLVWQMFYYGKTKGGESSELEPNGN